MAGNGGEGRVGTPADRAAAGATAAEQRQAAGEAGALLGSVLICAHGTTLDLLVHVWSSSFFLWITT